MNYGVTVVDPCNQGDISGTSLYKIIGIMIRWWRLKYAGKHVSLYKIWKCDFKAKISSYINRVNMPENPVSAHVHEIVHTELQCEGRAGNTCSQIMPYGSTSSITSRTTTLQMNNTMWGDSMINVGAYLPCIVIYSVDRKLEYYAH